MVNADVKCACTCGACAAKQAEGDGQEDTASVPGLSTTLALCKCPHRSEEKCCGGGPTVEGAAVEGAAAEGAKDAAADVKSCCAPADDAADAPAEEATSSEAAASAACCTPAETSEKRTWLVTLATGMATSGCCLLQLGLNLLPAFSTSGCFGFNTHLKKLRPLFAAATVAWFGRWAWRDFGPGRAPPASDEERRSRRAAARRFVLTAAASLLISLSPEIIALISRRRAAGAVLAASEKITIDVLDMGCEACSEAVGRALRALPGAAGGMANFKDGTATLFVQKGSAGSMSTDAISKALTSVGYGFGGIVSSVRLK